MTLHSLVNGREVAAKRLKRLGGMDRLRRICASAPTESLLQCSKQLVELLQATGEETGHGKQRQSLSPERGATKKRTEKGKAKKKSRVKQT